jgi:pimeloyl-ACP methyl ester carboxylesterase
MTKQDKNLRSEGFELSLGEGHRRVIRGRLDVPADAGQRNLCPTVLLIHGFKGFMNWGFFPELGLRLARAGYAAVSFNLSSSGIGADLENFTEMEAFEGATLSKDIEDIERVRHEVNKMAGLGADPERVAIMGHSKGGGEALLTAAESQAYRCVVTLAAIHSFERFDKETVSLWRKQGFLEIPNARTGQIFKLGLGGLDDLEANRERFDVMAAVRRIRVPSLFIHGTRDESVTVDALDHLCLARGGEAQALRLEGAGHTFGIKHPMEHSSDHFEQLWRRTEAFLDENLMVGTTKA